MFSIALDDLDAAKTAFGIMHPKNPQLPVFTASNARKRL
jgi:hypothetical protein